jgi:hypothetical protein
MIFRLFFVLGDEMEGVREWAITIISFILGGGDVSEMVERRWATNIAETSITIDDISFVLRDNLGRGWW